MSAGYTHLFGDGHEQVVEDFQQDGIHLCADRDPLRARLVSSQYQIVTRRDLGLPARFDQRGRAGFADDRGTDEAVAGMQLGAPVERGGNIVTGDVQRHCRGGLQSRLLNIPLLFKEGWRASAGVVRIEAATDDLNHRRLHDQRLVGHDKTVALAMGGLEAGLQFGHSIGGDAQGAVATGVAQANGADGSDEIGWNVLRFHFRPTDLFQFGEDSFQS